MNVNSFKKILRVLKPHVEIGGLEISDKVLSFMCVNCETGEIRQASVRIPEGVCKEGVILKEDQFLLAAQKLHACIKQKRTDEIPVIVSISDAHIYTQTFSLPALKSSGLEEAIKLNMETVSPIPFEKAYSDWERIIEGGSNRMRSISSQRGGSAIATIEEVEAEVEESGEVEILGSFVEKNIIDTLVRLLERAGFGVMAIEQKAFSLIRGISSQMTGRGDDAYILLSADSDGLSFSIVRFGYLYFNRFSSWASIASETMPKEEMSVDEFKNHIIRELHQITNFYTSRFHATVANLYIIAPGMEDQIQAIIEGNFSLKIQRPVFMAQTLDRSWFVAFGAALRGTIPRSRDVQISLSPEGTEIHYTHSQIISFGRLWRVVSITVFIIILVSYAGVFAFLNMYRGSVISDIKKSLGSANMSRLTQLEAEAKRFNDNIARALAAKSQQVRWYELLSQIYATASSEMLIDRIYVQSPKDPVTINARAIKESVAIDFKNKLEKIKGISGVELPLSSIVQVDQNTVTFKVLFHADTLSF